MDEIISGVQVIKMYAWEVPFAKLVAKTRKLELNIIRKTSFVRGLYMTFTLFTTRMSVFCTILAIVMLNGSHEITADRVFVISSYFSIISLTMNQMFIRGVAEISESLVALDRLQNFLELEEKHTQSITDNSNKYAGKIDIDSDNSLQSNVAVSMHKATATWKVPSPETSIKKKTKHQRSNQATEEGNALMSSQANPTLSNINVEFPKGKLIGVIGPVGAGKSSLLQALLRELPLDSGSLSLSGSTSYASQEPWVFAASVRQNILFGQEYDNDRYNNVVRSCALQRDFEQFENGDRLIIGEKGSLSGGQKARIKYIFIFSPISNERIMKFEYF